MEAQLIEWQATIDGIKAKAQKASAAGHGEVSRRFEELRTAGEDEVAAIIVGVWKSIAARRNV